MHQATSLTPFSLKGCLTSALLHLCFTLFTSTIINHQSLIIFAAQPYSTSPLLSKRPKSSHCVRCCGVQATSCDLSSFRCAKCLHPRSACYSTCYNLFFAAPLRQLWIWRISMYLRCTSFIQSHLFQKSSVNLLSSSSSSAQHTSHLNDSITWSLNCLMAVLQSRSQTEKRCCNAAPHLLASEIIATWLNSANTAVRHGSLHMH